MYNKRNKRHSLLCKIEILVPISKFDAKEKSYGKEAKNTPG